MSEISFDRLFSMSSFEGLRLIRREIVANSKVSLDDLPALILKVEPNANSLDLDAAFYLHSIVDINSPFQGHEFYRNCISAVIIIALPAWAKLITLGRKRFIQKLYGEEYRDVKSLFRQAGLLQDPPTIGDIAWWDHVSGRVRLEGDRLKLERARIAERLSLELERKKLILQGITTYPQWIAIEDNTAGYDVLSYTKTDYGLANKLIEVKSTIASPLRFYITRNEWEHALEVGEAYFFHIWNMQTDPPFLYEKSSADIAPHIPQDNEKGKWKTAEIPVSIS
ncbi:MAG: hypothetical protein JWR05_211 [Mucilaginibacter sp.]|nr:hypothetical protein [Mucilaginibacter sp.]